MEYNVQDVLKDCGINKLKNCKEEILQLIDMVKLKYNIHNYCNDNITDFLVNYNNLSVDASVALRKSMRLYNFHGGFQISLKYIIDESDCLYDEFAEIQKGVDDLLFPIGNAFSEIISLSQAQEVYVSNMRAAENWETFLYKLVTDSYRYI